MYLSYECGCDFCCLSKADDLGLTWMVECFYTPMRSRLKCLSRRYNVYLLTACVSEGHCDTLISLGCLNVQAMQEEIQSLKENETWDACKAYLLKLVIQSEDMTWRIIERYKAQLVARDFSHEYGVDYDDTFSPVAKLATVWVLLALTANKSWKSQ